MDAFVQKLREPVSGLTHLLGAILSFVGLILLLHDANGESQLIAFAVFGISMVLLYLSSSLYHLLPVSPDILRQLRRMDHFMIYMLIAGSFTPFIMLVLTGTLKWLMLSGVWGLAAIGIFLKTFWLNMPRWVSTIYYLGMGWFGVVMFPALYSNFSHWGLLWIVIGGLAYSIGAVIYASGKPNPWPGVFGSHEIWHLFVMAGSFCHFWAVYHFLAQ